MEVNGYFSAAKSSPGMSTPDRKDQAANLAMKFFFIALSSYYARKMCNRDALELHVLFIDSVFKAFILL